MLLDDRPEAIGTADQLSATACCERLYVRCVASLNRSAVKSKRQKGLMRMASEQSMEMFVARGPSMEIVSRSERPNHGRSQPASPVLGLDVP